jgi:uncharacterized Ntn-hydrolase superfamily protein
MNFNPAYRLSTYSIVARDPDTGQFGVAVQTHQMGVGWIVPWLLPGMGAVATQASVNISFGPMALSMLREGLPAQQIIDALAASDPGAHRRQMAVVDREGHAAAWTGKDCIPEAHHHVGEGYSVQANMMTNDTVLPAMTAAFEKATGDLAQQMLAALRAAQAEDGDIRGMQSAALKVVPGDTNKPTWAVDYDLRVDEHENPVEELARLVRLHHALIAEERGYEALEQDNIDQALAAWAAARAEAPELEELAFWQATTLADKVADVQTAAAILRPVLANDPRRAQWIELIRRLEACGMIERKGAAQELIQAIGE